MILMSPYEKKVILSSLPNLFGYNLFGNFHVAVVVLAIELNRGTQ